MWLGIDFGTCFSSAALMLESTPRLVKDPVQHGYSLPSCVYLTPRGEMLVGHAAEYQRNRDASRYRREFKRDLGNYGSGSGGDSQYLIGDRPTSPEGLVAEIILKLKDEADQMVSGLGFQPLDSAVVTVPATYQDHKRRLMEEAGRAAGFHRVELLEEPVASAIYYSHAVKMDEGEVLLVYDLGGGTFDAALLQKKNGGYQFLSLPIGLERCGGVDFDRRIYQDFICRCSEAMRDLLTSHRQDEVARLARNVVSEACRDLKHQLSEAQDAEMSVVVPGVGSLERYSLTRQAFEEMTAPLIDQTLQMCDRLVETAGLRWDGVHRILLVGGSCRVPRVRQRLEQKLGRPVLRADELELVVCLGAAIFGAGLESPARRVEALDASVPVQEQAGTLVKAEDSVANLAEVIRSSAPGARVEVKPGIYRGSLVIDKSLELIASGPREETTLTSAGDPCLVLSSDGIVVKGFSIRHEAAIGEWSGSTPCGISIIAGQPTLEDCDISSAGGAGVIISGEQTSPLLLRCNVHDAAASGVIVYGRATGSLEECDLSHNSGSGLEIGLGADPSIRICRFHDNRGSGVSVWLGGRGTIEDCDIFGNASVGLAIALMGNPAVRRCTIRDGSRLGVSVISGGLGRLEECDIGANRLAGVAIARQSNPVLQGCDIHDGKEYGVLAHQGSRGELVGCDIHGNVLAGMMVVFGGEPVARECRFRDGLQTGICVRHEGRGGFQDCDISGNALAGVTIAVGGAPYLRNCRIHDGKRHGILAYEGGAGIIEDCDIDGNGWAGVAVAQYADPTFRHCRIHRGSLSGVFIHENGRGTFEDCEVFNTGRAGIEVTVGGSPLLLKSSIRETEGPGVLVAEYGYATLEDCSVYANRGCRVQIEEGSSLEATRCKFHKGSGPGIMVGARGQATVEECQIFSSDQAGIDVLGGHLDLRRSSVRRNSTQALCVRGSGSANVENCDLTGNQYGAWAIEEGCNVEVAWAEDLFTQLQQLLADRQWAEANKETIRLLRYVSGHDLIDNETKAQTVPEMVAAKIRGMWVSSAGLCDGLVDLLNSRKWVDAAHESAKISRWVRGYDQVEVGKEAAGPPELVEVLKAVWGSSELFDSLRQQLNLGWSNNADREAIGIIRAVTGCERIDKDFKSQAIPGEVLHLLNDMIIAAEKGPLSRREWVCASGELTSDAAWYTTETWLMRRLKAVGLAQ